MAEGNRTVSEWVDKRGITHWRGDWTAGVECSMCGWEHRENLYYADAGYTNQAANRHVKSLRHRWWRLIAQHTTSRKREGTDHV